jgi:hypothetical protein
VFDGLAPATHEVGDIGDLVLQGGVGDDGHPGGAEGERRDDAQIRAGTADAPEQVRIVGLVDSSHCAVGGDDLRGHQVVDRQAVRASHQPEPTGGGEAADADVSGVAGADREAPRPEGGRHVTPAVAGSDPHQVVVRVEAIDRGEPAKVDDCAPIVGGGAAHAVPAAADGQRAAGVAGERNRLRDLGGRAGPDDRRGAAGSGIDVSQRRIVAVAGTNDVQHGGPPQASSAPCGPASLSMK